MDKMNIEASVAFNDIEAAEGEDKPTQRSFEMLAYTGAAMTLAGWKHPVVVDLGGIEATEKPRPILRDHDPSKIVGHTSGIEITDEGLKVNGFVSAGNNYANEVVDSSRNGFPWQASIGARAQDVTRVRKGDSVTVNGKSFDGPIFVARRASLGEVSFVALGADDATTANVAATSANKEFTPMNEFTEWVSARGFVAEDLTDEQRSTLRAAFDAETSPAVEASVSETVNTDDAVADVRAAIAAETKRCAEIRAAAGGHHDIEAKAIDAGWDADRTELEVLRANRPVAGAPMINAGSAPIDEDTIAAAACMSTMVPDSVLTRSYNEKTLDAANKMRGMGLREMCAEAARLEGKDVPRTFGDGSATIRAGFSTVALPNILENVLGKQLLAAYESQPTVAQRVCRVSSVSDFKQVSRVRLDGTGGFEKVDAAGEIPHGKVTDTKYTNQAETYGQMLTLTRQDVINDDLGAFAQLPAQMGRYAANAVEDAFMAKLMDGGSHFGAGNGNIATGAITAAGVVPQIEELVTAFRKQKAGPASGMTADQIPVNIQPRMLLAPVELEFAFAQALASSELVGLSEKGTANPYRGRFELLTAPHLSDSYYTNASASAFYLFADPAAWASYELVFLNGVQTPTIERMEASANTLGISFRAYFDFGVEAMDPKAAAKHTGA